MSTRNYKTLIFMISTTFLGKILGMLRDVLLAYHYGTGMKAVAFITASRLPLNFFDFALGAIVSSAFIPVFNEVLKVKGKKRGIQFANEFVNAILLIASLITIIGVVLAPVLVKLIAGGLDGETYILTVSLTKIMFPMLIFTAVAFSFVGILQSFGEFNIPAAISIVSNLGMIIYFMFFNKYLGIEGLAISMVVGWFLQMIIQIPFLKKKGYVYKPTLNFKGEELKKIGIIILPILISTWVQPINIFVNTYLASDIDGGSAVAVLEYANKVFLIIAGVFVLALTNLVFPSMSKFIAENNKDGFKNLVIQSLRTIIFFMTPITVGLLVFSQLIIKVLFERGAFSNAETILTSKVLIFYSIGIVFYGIREVLNRAYYSKGNSKHPMKIAIVGIIVNIILSIILVEKIGINGLAISATISTIFIAITLIYSFDKSIDKIIKYDEFLYFIKVLLNSIVMGFIVNSSYNTLISIINKNSMLFELISALISTIVGIISYFIIAKVLKITIPKIHLNQKES